MESNKFKSIIFPACILIVAFIVCSLIILTHPLKSEESSDKINVPQYSTLPMELINKYQSICFEKCNNQKTWFDLESCKVGCREMALSELSDKNYMLYGCVAEK